MIECEREEEYGRRRHQRMAITTSVDYGPPTTPVRGRHCAFENDGRYKIRIPSSLYVPRHVKP